MTFHGPQQKKTIRHLLENINVKVNTKATLFESSEWGRYDSANDVILIDKDFRTDFPKQALLVLIHELMHSTGVNQRNGRWMRLSSAFGDITTTAKTKATEEIICEIAGFVIARNIGMLDEASKNIFIHGINTNRNKIDYIPWREVVSAVSHYTDKPDTMFKDLIYARNFCRMKFGITFKDTYEST